VKKLTKILMAGAAATAVVIQFTGPTVSQTVPAGTEWPTYGHDRGGQRFSPLTQITPQNVANLKPAWVYHMRPEGYVAPGRGGAAAAPAGGRGAAPPDQVAQQAAAEGAPPAAGRGGGRGGAGTGFSASEVTPLVINGVMYISSPYGRVVALDPQTGKEVWVYQLPSGAPATRGVEYFEGDATTPAQIVVTTADAKLFTLDAKTGQLNPKFGVDGIVDLNTPEILKGYPGSNGLSSPAIMYKNLIIVGGRTTEANGPGPAGDVRAFDIHDGKLKWTFHSIPQPGEKNFGTWAGDSWRNRSGVNVWGLMTVDTERGIVYMPFGAPSSDGYGVDRPGNNLYSSSIVAANANTGEYLWHFQLVHHDIWDMDMQSPPLLLDVRQNGRTIPAVAVINKTGLLHFFNRVTGEHIYGVDEKPVPASNVPLEKVSPTQPFPRKPVPLSKMTMTMEDIATVTPELEAACKKLIADRNVFLPSQPFTPAGYNRISLQLPGNHGGSNWGGMSYNPDLGYIFVNTNNLGQLAGYRDRPAPVATAPAGAPAGVPVVAGGGRGAAGGPTADPGSHFYTPYAGMPGGGRFKDTASNMMCQQPPWGELIAINVHTGDIAWRKNLGVTDSLPADKQNTGRPNNGGSIATKSGVVFIAATDDARFRAFDARTGAQLWETKLPAVAHAVPSTYLGRDGKQYVVITSTGGGFLEAPTISDTITAFTVQ
jgi:quinoprotein glucose dehydrogenase